MQLYVGIGTLIGTLITLISLVIYWPKNGHNWCQVCTIRRTEVVINTKRNHISAECDMQYHTTKTTI